MIRDPHDEGHVVLHEQHRHAEVGVHTAQQARHRVHLLMADAAGRLIEQKEPRARDERAGELDPLL